MKDDKPDYEKLLASSSDDSSTSEISEQEGHDLYTLQQQNALDVKTRHLNRLLVGNVAIFFISLVLLVVAYFLRTPAGDSYYTSKYSSYSPARPAVSYLTGMFNATQGYDTGYVGTSDETEEMWNWVTTDIGDQMITPEELKLVEKPESSIKVIDPHTGKEGYRIGLEVFHQLHCLNLLRKSTFMDVYAEGSDFKGKSEEEIREHLDHCLEMIRMNIMCQVDIGVITFHELPGKKAGDPWPDFSTKHVCRDFDAVRDWAIENTVANDDIF